MQITQLCDKCYKSWWNTHKHTPMELDFQKQVHPCTHTTHNTQHTCSHIYSTHWRCHWKWAIAFLVMELVQGRRRRKEEELPTQWQVEVDAGICFVWIFLYLRACVCLLPVWRRCWRILLWLQRLRAGCRPAERMIRLDRWTLCRPPWWGRLLQTPEPSQHKHIDILHQMLCTTLCSIWSI